MGCYFVLKATAVLFKIQGKAMFPLTRFARRCPSQPASIETCLVIIHYSLFIIHYSLFIDQMKKVGARLVFLIFTDKNLADDKGTA